MNLRQLEALRATMQGRPYRRLATNGGEKCGLAASLLLIPVFLAAQISAAEHHKQVVGATEVIEIQSAGLRFKARIDTGAKTSSIHAENIEIDPSGDPQGKPIAFTLVNKQGQSQQVDTHITRMITVKTSEGSEIRYAVPLTVNWKNSSKTVLVTLNNRKHMQYGLLLGRNWLQGDFVVDIAINNDDHNEN
jgi:hypothetical protein